MQPNPTFAAHYDAIIVGARCAGAATAMLMARQGARVLVVDWAEPGSDTMSTHALMRGAVIQLNRWGVLDTIIAAGTPAIHTTTFQYGETVISLALKPSHGVDALYAPRRTVLDKALVDAAKQAGAEFRFGVSFKDVIRDPQGRVVVRSLDRLMAIHKWSVRTSSSGRTVADPASRGGWMHEHCDWLKIALPAFLPIMTAFATPALTGFMVQALAPVKSRPTRGNTVFSPRCHRTSFRPKSGLVRRSIRFRQY